MSLPSLAEVEHADWSDLKRMAESLGLNPKGRSALVRMRVLVHVRHHARPEPWRAEKDHVAALLTRLGVPELAEEVWESTIQLDAPGPWVGLGDAQLAAGSVNEATRSFDRATRMGDAAALLHRAEVFAAQGDYNGAVQVCKLYLASHPGDLRGTAMQADFLARAGFADEAARVFRSLAESRREIPGVVRAGGTALLKAGRPDTAVDMFDEAIRLEPTDVVARTNRGAALLAVGRMQEAVSAFREALEMAPERAEILNNLGVADLRLGHGKSARAHIERASALIDSPRILLNLEKVRGSESRRVKSRRTPRANPKTPLEKAHKHLPRKRKTSKPRKPQKLSKPPTETSRPDEPSPP